MKDSRKILAEWLTSQALCLAHSQRHACAHRLGLGPATAAVRSRVVKSRKVYTRNEPRKDDSAKGGATIGLAAIRARHCGDEGSQ
jgi:hypothetical protein